MSSKKKPEIEALWTQDDVADFLKVGKSKVAELTALKKIPSIRIGRALRYLPEDVYKWAKKQAS